MPLKRAALFLLAAACAHGTPAEPPVDQQAIDEARSVTNAEPVSARAYQHYLDAILARDAGDLSTAESELREALLYDPGSPHLHTVLAGVLLKQGRIAAAEEELRSALALDPSHAPAHLMLARIAEARDRPEEARTHLRAAMDAAPRDPDAYRELVRLELSLGNIDAARDAAGRLSQASHAAQLEAKREDEDEDETGAALVAADRLRDEASGAWVDVARELAQRQEDAEAEQAFNRAREEKPSDPEALAAEASFLESQRRFGEARDLYLRLLAQRPEAPDVIASLARLALIEGDLDTVHAHERKLLGLVSGFDKDDASPDHEDDRRELAGALLRTASALLGAHRSADAQDAIDGALKLYPGHLQLAFYRATALVQRGHPREGARAFEEVERRLRDGEKATPDLLGIDPSALALEAALQAAMALGRAGEVQEAARRVREIFLDDPTGDGVPLALVEALERAGQLADAEQLLAAAVQDRPDDGELLYALASAQDRLGQQKAALATMRKVLAVQPAHTGALNYIGYTLVEQGDPASLREASELLARAVELRPDDGAIADSYGYCLLKQGRVNEALSELRRADRLEPGDPVILSHLGDALLAAGQRAEALDAFRRALARLEPRPAKAPRRRQQEARLDPSDRAPEPGDDKVRTELLQKVRTLEGSAP